MLAPGKFTTSTIFGPINARLSGCVGAASSRVDYKRKRDQGLATQSFNIFSPLNDDARARFNSDMAPRSIDEEQPVQQPPALRRPRAPEPAQQPPALRRPRASEPAQQQPPPLPEPAVEVPPHADRPVDDRPPSPVLIYDPVIQRYVELVEVEVKVEQDQQEDEAEVGER